MKLITVKEYCKIEGITDAGARKRVSSELVKSVILDNITYVVVDSSRDQDEAKALKVRLRNANDKIKLLQAEKQTIVDQKDFIKKLEDKIESLENKLDAVQIKKDELYEKVIGHFTLAQISR
jgi:hypothetical protein